MAQTTRIAFSQTGPTTEYWEGADLVAQSQAGNYSVIRVSATAINRGNTSSYSGANGAHTAAVDGIGQTQRTGTQPSGVGTNATRWDQAVDLGVAHDGAGNSGGVTLRQTVTGWGATNVQTAYLGGFPRIPKRPSPPGVPSFTNILPTSVTVYWSGSADNSGSGIDAYLLRYWPNAEGTGPYTDFSQVNDTSRIVTGLTPGQEYRFVVYAHNGSADNSGYSDSSGAAVVRTLSGMWAKWQGAWKRTVPFVKVAGEWKAVSVFIKDAGTWKRGG